MKKGIIFVLLLTSYFYGFTQSTGKYQIKFLEVNKNNSDYGVAILDNNKLIFTSAEEEVVSYKKNFNPRKELFVGDIDYDLVYVPGGIPGASNICSNAQMLDLLSSFSAKNKYIASHYLSYNITKRLNIGLFESVIWENDGDGFNLTYMNPIIFYQSIQ